MIVRLAVFFCILVPYVIVLAPVQAVLLASGRGWSVLPLGFHRIAAFVLGLEIVRHGAPAPARPLLLLANHVSWLDVIALGTLGPMSFLAKAEVGAALPLRLLSAFQRTLFVDRTRRSDLVRSSAEIGARLGEGTPVVLFAEGTSSLGTHVLPFRPALVSAARAAPGTLIQPLAIAYTRLEGLPLSRRDRSDLAWVGAMGPFDTLGPILARAPKRIEIAFADPFAAGPDRKADARRAEAAVRAMLRALNRGTLLPGLDKARTWV